MCLKNIVVVAIVVPFYSVCLTAAEPTQKPLEMIQSENPAERFKGFHALIKPVREYNCEFATTNDIDEDEAKVLLGQLLRKEKTFDFDGDYSNRYGIKVSGRELYARKKEKKVMKYLYAKEGYGIYISDLQAFMDSCEEESLVDLFPGPKTFSRYLEKSTEAAFKKLNEIEKSDDSVKRKYEEMLLFLGDAAIKNRDVKPEFYNRVKKKIVELSENGCLAVPAIGIMGEMGDSDLIPILEKISKFDDSKGCVLMSDGKEKLLPISDDAKRMLKYLQVGKSRNRKSSNIPKNVSPK